MKFNETVLYGVTRIPSEEFNKSCGYVFALKTPALVLFMIVAILAALFVDFILAICSIGGNK